MQRDVCVRCHFYQPPQEDLWLEVVELRTPGLWILLLPTMTGTRGYGRMQSAEPGRRRVCLWIAVAVVERRSFEAQYAINSAIPSALESHTAESKHE